VCVLRWSDKSLGPLGFDGFLLAGFDQLTESREEGRLDELFSKASVHQESILP
jgi:hypothetical protein